MGTTYTFSGTARGGWGGNVARLCAHCGTHTHNMWLYITIGRRVGIKMCVCVGVGGSFVVHQWYSCSTLYRTIWVKQVARVLQGAGARCYTVYLARVYVSGRGGGCGHVYRVRDCGSGRA